MVTPRATNTVSYLVDGGFGVVYVPILTMASSAFVSMTLFDSLMEGCIMIFAKKSEHSAARFSATLTSTLSAILSTTLSVTLSARLSTTLSTTLSMTLSARLSVTLSATLSAISVF